MKNINGYLKNIIGAEFSKIFNVSNETIDNSSFVVEYPKNKSDGELSTNICMVLAKEISANPVEAAKTLIKSLEKIEDFEMLEVAGPGFLNFNISKDTWFKFLIQLLETNLLFNEEIGLNKILMSNMFLRILQVPYISVIVEERYLVMYYQIYLKLQVTT